MNVRHKKAPQLLKLNRLGYRIHNLQDDWQQVHQYAVFDSF